MQRFTTSSEKSAARRSGLAAVETAVCLPLLVVVVFSAIDIANIIHVKQTLNIAGYEAATSASKTGGHFQTAMSRAQDVLRSRGITNARVSISPRVNHNTPSGRRVTVTIRADVDGMTLAPLNLFQNRTMTTQVRMVRL